MNKNFSLQSIPNTLDVNELMEVKGGFTIGPICIPSGSVKCEKGANAVIKCEGSPAVAVCEGETSAVTVNPTPGDGEIGEVAP
ncbi:MAG: hypothetical protein K1V81_03835 [Paramuribaculum sp.]|jgi:hypothetical protein